MQTSLCRIKLRRGKEADRVKVVPEEGEPIFSTDAGRLAVGNGITPGGVALNKTLSSVGDANKYGIPGDIVISTNTNNKITAHVISNKNNTSTDLIQIGGDGLFTTSAPLTAIDANISLNINSDGEYIHLDSINNQLTINQQHLIDVMEIQNENLTTVENLNANRITGHIAPVFVTNIPFKKVIDTSVEGVTGATDDNTYITNDEFTDITITNGISAETSDYKIDRGIKLLCDETTVTTINKNIDVYELQDDGTYSKTVRSMPHLSIIQTGTVDDNRIEILSSQIETLSSQIETLSSQPIGSYVIKTDSSGDGNGSYYKWCRKYSDGWIEQGGYQQNNYANTKINFLTNFASTNYTIICTSLSGETYVDYYGGLYISNKYKTYVDLTFSSKTPGISWYACGTGEML